MKRTVMARGGLGRAMLAAVAAAGVLAAAVPVATAQQRGGNPGQPGGPGQSGAPGKNARPGRAAQPGNPPAASRPSILDTLMKRGKTRDWTMRVSINVHSYQQVTEQGAPILEQMNLKTAAVVFPLNPFSASSELDQENFVGELSFDDVVVDASPKFLDGYPGGTRLARWGLTDKTGTQMGLELEIPVTTWALIFDEAKGMKVPWPASWPDSASSVLRPDAIVNSGAEEVQRLVREWTVGQDPKKVPPVQLAKFLAGKVMEHVQLSGNGLVFAKNGLLAGVELQSVEETAKEGRGSDHDAVVLLAAVYRAVGLPARTVIGLDMSAKKDKDEFLSRGGKKGPAKLRPWVEFCLYDEGAQKELWVPVDIVAIRGSSSRSPALNRPWKFFGTHDEMENVIPFAFQYHPPTTVVAHGAFSFWGWLPTPSIPNVNQFLTFSAITTPKRASDRQRDRR